MPDPWEYPWYASWDLAFHCVPLAHLDPEFAKRQLILLSGSGTCTPTASCPPTSGTSATPRITVHGEARLLLPVVDGAQLLRVLSHVFDHEELLSPGLRSLSQQLRNQPFTLDANGVHWSIDCEPAESANELFGGNANWRGPIWFPLNYLLIESLDRFARYFGDDFLVEYPPDRGGS